MSPEPTLTILEKHGFHLCTEPVSITTIVSAICTNTNLVDSVIVAKRINPEVASENTHCCVGYRDAVVRVSMPRRLESHHGEERQKTWRLLRLIRSARVWRPGLRIWIWRLFAGFYASRSAQYVVYDLHTSLPIKFEL